MDYAMRDVALKLEIRGKIPLNSFALPAIRIL